MKKLTKTLLFAFASLFLTSSLFAATIHEGDAAQKSFELTANKQYGDNYETQNNVGVILPKEYEAKAGEKIVWDYTFVITKDAQANSGKKGCRWVISSSPKQNKPVTFKTTKFTYKIER